MSLYGALSFILRHPMNRGRPADALGTFLRWQLSSRIGFPMAVPFVDETRLLVQRGMSGATGNVYCGLADFEEMGFVMHALRPSDLFFDIGANVGAYTVLASGVAGASVLAFEPVPSTFRHLQDNIALNNLTSVDARDVALGATSGVVPFTSNEGTVNHALAEGENEGESIAVTVQRLDEFQPIEAPPLSVLKIDVEGFEARVVDGGAGTLENPSVRAVIMELLNGSGCRYGWDDWKLHDRMLEMDFRLHRYDPVSRALFETDEIIGGNNLYVRDAEMLRERVTTAPKRRVHGTLI
jgi:FkbM family methyltransferase